MRHRRPLYLCRAGVEPNNLLQSGSGSEQWLWTNQASSSGIARTPFRPVTSWIKVAEGWTLHHCEAGVKPNNLPESDSGSEQWLWRTLPSRSGIARVPVKTTPTMISDFRGFDATETSFIPLRSWRRAQQPTGIRFRIGVVAVERSAIEFWDRHSTCKDNPHKGQRFPEPWCDRDVLYTAAYLASSPTTSRNEIQDQSCGCGGICPRVLGSPEYL